MSSASCLTHQGALELIERARGGVGCGSALPIAPRTYAIRAMIPTNSPDSGRVAMRFSGPVLVVGFYANVGSAPPTLQAGPPIVESRWAPKIDDFVVAMQVNRDGFTTYSDEANFVPLGGLVLPNRAHLFIVDGTAPELGFTFASSYAFGGVSNLPALVGVGLSAFVIPIGG